MKINYIVRITIVIFWFPIWICPQYTRTEIDSLIKKSEKYSNDNKPLSSIRLGKEIINKSEQINYRKGTITGYNILAYELCGIGNYEKSINYISLVQEKYKDSIEVGLKYNVFITNLKGRNYLAMGFHKEAVKTFKILLKLAEKHKEKNDIIWHKRLAYVQLASCYEKSNKDSLYFYLTKALHWHVQFKGSKNDEKKQQTPLFLNLADYHITYTNNLDSAYYYINKGSILHANPKNKSSYFSDFLLAKIFLKEKKFESALVSSFSALDNAIKKNKTDFILSNYLLLSKIYKSKGDNLNEKKYNYIYYKYKDSLNTARNGAIQTSSDLIQKEAVAIGQKRNYNFLWWIGSIFFIMIFIGIYKIQRLEKNKRKLLIESSNQLSALQDKVNDAYNEIIELAKNNENSFFLRFQEVYPDFCYKLTELNPHLKVTELTFCAFLKLNFSTKEIAYYTNITSKSVQNKKNRIRKKLNIPSDEDIYLWLNKL